MSDPSSNLGRLRLFVEGHLQLAASLASIDGACAAARRLDGWAGQVQSQLASLAGDRPPPHLDGLSAFDLAEARDRLSSAAAGYRQAARLDFA